MVNPNVAERNCRTGLPTRLFQCETVYDPMLMEFTQCEIYKEQQQDHD
jgi:hypothetical protein